MPLANSHFWESNWFSPAIKQTATYFRIKTWIESLKKAGGTQSAY
jgi:hypothetical protein